MGKPDTDPVTTTLYPLKLYLAKPISCAHLYEDDTCDALDPAARFEEVFADRVPVPDAHERALTFCPCDDCPSQPADRFQEQTRTLLMETYPERAGKIVRVRCMAGCDFKKLGRAIADRIDACDGFNGNWASAEFQPRRPGRRPKRTF